MADRSSSDDVELIRYFTAARRIPLTFGRLSDGMRIPGGPYSGMQVAAGAIALVTSPVLVAIVLGDVPAVLKFALAIAGAWGAAYGAGYLPSTFRNPLMVASDAIRILTQSGAGSYNGRRWAAPRRRATKPRQRRDAKAVIERTQLPAIPAQEEQREVVSVADTQVVIPPEDERSRPFLQPQEDENGVPVLTGLERLRSLANEQKGSSR